MNSQQAREMHELAERNGLKNVVNFTFRGFPASTRMRELIADGYVGDVYLINVQYFADYAMPDAPIRWRQDKPISGSGVLGDLGSHAIDQARLYGGEIARVCSHLLTVAQQRKLPNSEEMVDIHVDDCAALIVEFESGAQGVIHTSWCTKQAHQGQMQDISVYGSEGMLRLERTMSGGDKLVGVRGESRTLESIPMPPEYEHGDTVFLGYMVKNLPTPPKELINSICTGKIDTVVGPTFRDGLKAQEVMDGALKSHEKGSWITL
jgi:predicted dehydrogenase